MRRIVVILLALAAIAVMPQVAQAVEPHWLWAKPAEVIPEGTVVPVETFGGLTFVIKGPKKEKIAKIQCKLVDRDLIENPVGGGAGVDEMITFEFTSCSFGGACTTGAPYSLQPAGLPWSSKLLAGSPIKNGLFMEFNLTCGGAILSTFKGMEFPTIKGFGGMKFAPATGTLTDGFGNTMMIAGKDNMKGPPGKEKISAV
ncbi:MAG TPA: hypothetical protein VGD00_05465 [Solirubrobacteraceae bacterium]|jgi:hypothetical protein